MNSIIIASCIGIVLNFSFLNLAFANTWVTYYTSKTQILKYDEDSVRINNQLVTYKSESWYLTAQSPDTFIEMQTLNCSTLEKKGAKNREEVIPLPATVNEYSRIKLCMQVWDRTSVNSSKSTGNGYFIGEKKDGKPNGFGYYKDNDGFSYLGFWDNGKYHGKGIARHKDFSFYYGNWEKGQKKGFGSYYYKSLSGTYKGEWDHDSRNGTGVYRYSDGRHYIGTWLDNKKHGSGILKWPDGDFYKGDFIEDKMHGKGTYYYADGRKISGKWKDNEFIESD